MDQLDMGFVLGMWIWSVLRGRATVMRGPWCGL